MWFAGDLVELTEINSIVSSFMFLSFVVYY